MYVFMYMCVYDCVTTARRLRTSPWNLQPPHLCPLLGVKAVARPARIQEAGSGLARSMAKAHSKGVWPKEAGFLRGHYFHNPAQLIIVPHFRCFTR